MKLLFTICARAGSKGVKNKNSRHFLDSPLVLYTLAVYKLFIQRYGSEYDTISLALNTDSETLINQVNQTNIEYQYIKRKEELGGDVISKIEVIKDTVNQMEKIKNSNFDIIVDLDLTSPLRRVEDIYKVINILLEKKDADVIFSMTNSRRSPFFNMVDVKEDGYYRTIIESEYVSRQQAPQCFDMNASIYAYKRDYILNDKSKKVFDGKAIGVKVMDTAVLDIDNEEDLELMEIIADYFYKKYEDYGEINKEVKNLYLMTKQQGY